MTISGDCPQGRSQHFTFSRRGLLQNLASAALPFLVPRVQSDKSFFGGRPLPEFKLGDLVAEDWLDDEDEMFSDFGEVVGMCYLPEKTSCFSGSTWVYFINWTHSTSGAGYCYPCYDGEPSEAGDLRLVNYA